MKGGDERLLQPSSEQRDDPRDNKNRNNNDNNNNNNVIINPLQIQGRAGSKQVPVRNLPKTMRHNSDGTASIYTPANDKSGDVELFTEIPFFAFHGMQTRGRDECDVVGTYVDNFHGVWEGDGVSCSEGKTAASTGKLTPSLLIATITTATLQFLVGFNVVILNTPEKYVFPGHRTIYWSMAVASLAIGAPIGAWLGGKIAAEWGRRYTLILNIVIFFGGGCLQTFAPSLAVITLARFIVGIASGFATVLVPIYLGELAPPSLRGAIGTVNQFAFVIGILGADLFSFRFANEDSWRQLFAVTVVISGAQLILSYFVVESPRWLLEKDPNDPLAAKDILQQLRGYQTQDELEHELATYTQASKAHGQEKQSHSAVLAQMMSRSQDRYLFFCIIILHTAKKLSGVNAVFYYSTSLFEGVIDDPLLATTLIGTVNVVFTYVALLLMDSCRRKSLILWSLGGMFAACSTLILAQTGVLPNIMALVAVNVYVAFFAIGIGPIPWLIIAEMFEAKYITAIMIICSQLAWIVEFLVSLVFPSINHVLGDFTFVPFACNLAMSYIFVWVALPETHGRTPAQVLVDVKLRASYYAEKLSVTADLGGCSGGGDWEDKVLA